MKRWVTRNNSSAKRPFLYFFHQTGANRVCQNIITDFCEGVPFAFFVAQNVVMGLWLEFERSKKRFQMRSQEGHSISLVCFPFQAKPNQMDVIRHQAVYG